MTAMPTGKVRPPIDAPRLGAHEVCNPDSSVTIRKLSSYRFRDDSEWTMHEFDYRLRWTLYVDHRYETLGGKNVAHAHATVEVWSHRHTEWHQVWELSRKAESPHGVKTDAKLRDWNALLSELAQYASEVLT